MTLAPISPRTVTVLGSHWPASYPWDGFWWARASVRTAFAGTDYYLRVPWCHPDDRSHTWPPQQWYRVRLKRGWKAFRRVKGIWMVQK